MGTDAYLTLPIQVTGRADIGRLLREVEQIDNFLKQAAIRQPGTPVKMPKTSRLLDEFAGSNKVNLLHDEDRARTLNFLIAVKAKAPVLHMSFSVDPSPGFIQRLTTWLRTEIHPLVLLQVGLQPNIGAGCVVRGTNRYFDLSLREHFKKQKLLLVDKLHGDMQTSVTEAQDANPVSPDVPPAAPEPPTEVRPSQATAPAHASNISPSAQQTPAPAGSVASAPPVPETQKEVPHA